jgi:hypothetical protein
MKLPKFITTSVVRGSQQGVGNNNQGRTEDERVKCLLDTQVGGNKNWPW